MKKNQKEKIINSLELPKDLMLGAAIVTATGRHEVLISNYKGILEYEDSFIKIQTKNCRILISGSHLAIDYYTNEEDRPDFLRCGGSKSDVHRVYPGSQPL